MQWCKSIKEFDRFREENNITISEIIYDSHDQKHNATIDFHLSFNEIITDKVRGTICLKNNNNVLCINGISSVLLDAYGESYVATVITDDDCKYILLIKSLKP